MKRVAISTLGCKTNQFESAAMSEQLSNAGYQVVPFNDPADFYIINSCTVTAKTDAESRRLIRRARRLNPAARIIATGCYAQVAPGDLEQMPELDCVLGNQEKQHIATLLESSNHTVSDIAVVSSHEPLQLNSFAEHTRAFLQIQNGCNSFCTYCIVPYARGRSRSVTAESVIKGIEDFAASGFKEVVLTGIHLGAYGLDLPDPSNLTQLIQEIDRRAIVPRLRIGSLEPNEVSDELLQLMAHSTRICPHLHLPLQSGSDSVLQRMGRHYSARYFRELVARIVSALPDAFIGADVIAGFPGESDAEFQETVQLIHDLPFADLHVFPYSSRPGTKAADMPGHLPARIITERAALLRTMAQEKKQAYMARFVGRELKVLVQKTTCGSDANRGLSRNYLDVAFAGNDIQVNNEIRIKITKFTGNSCFGDFVTS